MKGEAYVRRETTVSIFINVALSLGFFLLVFGTAETVPVWGPGHYAFDFIPQTFMIALMSTLVPGALTARRLLAGKVQRLAGTTRLPSHFLPRALLLAVLAVIVGASTAALVLWLTGPEYLSWRLAVTLKLLYGGLVAALITPLGLQGALRTGNT